jgi:hypothetical protein
MQLEHLTSSVPAIYELSLGLMNVRYGGVADVPFLSSARPTVPACPPPTPSRGVLLWGGVLFNNPGGGCLARCFALLLTAVMDVWNIM